MIETPRRRPRRRPDAVPDGPTLTPDERTLVWRTAWRIVGQDADAADVCQDVLHELLTTGGLATARCRAATLRWLTTRRALDSLRRRARRPGLLPEGAEAAIADTGPPPDAAAELAELTDRLRAALAELPEGQAAAFWLAAVEQRPQAEVAEALSSTAAAVGQLVRRARVTLRQRLAAFDPNRIPEEGRR